MKKIYALILLAVVIASCKDDDPKLSVEQYMTAAANGWVYESILVTNPANGQQVDALKDPTFSSQIEQCDIDDATIFTTDGKYKVMDNTKCDASDPDIADTGTWTLSSDKATLTMTSDGGGPLSITKFSADDNNLRGDISNLFGLPISATIVLKKK